MATPERLGQKRNCPSCGARFYDLGKNPAHCPKCEHEFNTDVTVRRRARGERRASRQMEEEGDLLIAAARKAKSAAIRKSKQSDEEGADIEDVEDIRVQPDIEEVDDMDDMDTIDEIDKDEEESMDDDITLEEKDIQGNKLIDDVEEDEEDDEEEEEDEDEKPSKSVRKPVKKKR